MLPETPETNWASEPGAQPNAFVLMPFASDLNWLYEVIRSAGGNAGVLVERSDDIFAAGIIIEQVKARIRAANIVIAVCTGRNANVFYELGIADAFHRPILVAEGSKDLPFDVQHFRAQFYGQPEGSEDLRERITQAIRETLDERSSAGIGELEVSIEPSGFSALEQPEGLASDMVDRPGWRAWCGTSSQDLTFGLGALLHLESTGEEARYIRCRVFTPEARSIDSSSLTFQTGNPQTSETRHYPGEFAGAPPLSEGEYRFYWLGDLGDWTQPNELLLAAGKFSVNAFGQVECPE